MFKDEILSFCSRYDISVVEFCRRAGIGKNSVYRWGKITPQHDCIRRVRLEMMRVIGKEKRFFLQFREKVV